MNTQRKALPTRDGGRGLIFLAYLMPLGIYLLILATLNRSRHPVMVAGTWDFAGVLLAASGFLLLGGPAILSGFHEQWRVAWLLGRARFLQGLGTEWSFWLSLWIVYFLAVILGAILFLRLRRLQTAIYNIDPETLESVLRDLPQRLAVQVDRPNSDEWFFSPLAVPVGHESVLGGSAHHTVGAPTGASGPHRSAVPFPGWPAGPERMTSTRRGFARVTVEVFRPMRHATLRWDRDGDPTLRRALENELAQALAEVPGAENPAAAWFMSLAVSILLLTAFAATAIILLRLYELRS